MPTPTGLTLRQLAERDVFPTYPQVGRYFAATAIEDARKRIGRAIERGDGPALVIGAPGTGKSLLLQVFAAQYHNRFDLVLLACARLCTRRALLQAVLFELGLPYKLRDEGELRFSLLDHLLTADESTTGLLLLVDEAQALPVALLDELRVMTNLVRGDRPRVRLVLAGTSTLEETFAHPELESFSQRLSARCYLSALGRDETRQFIRAQLAAAQGAPDELIAADAWDTVIDATDGVPRLVNQLCDRALQFAAADGRARIDREVIQSAWSDIQQLPASWSSPQASLVSAAKPDVVEFGGLSDGPPIDSELRSDAMADVEPTELDVEDDLLPIGNEAIGSAPPEAAETLGPDPFAEQFEEEEVVLDRFAAWEDLFRRDVPRVENRRDPGFAALVETAMDASSARWNEHVETSSVGILREQVSAELTSDVDEPVCDADADWPPLRLALVSDPLPLKPIPLLPPSASVEATAAAWDKLMTTIEIGQGTGKKVATQSPVLLVDEEYVPGKPAPPVRREAYRNLFSRLRSG